MALIDSQVSNIFNSELRLRITPNPIISLFQVFAFVLLLLLPLSCLSDLNSFKLPGDAVDFR